MRIITIATVTVSFWAAGVVGAQAVQEHHSTLCARAEVVRKQVVREHGRSSAGHDICRLAQYHAGGLDLPPTTHARAMYLRQLRALERSPAYLSVYPGLPRQPPAGVMTAHYRPQGLARCIAYAESGNDPTMHDQAVHTGVAQWDADAWRADDGLRYAPYPTAATYDQQMKVLSYGLVHYACSQWCPFDPCG